MVVFNQRGQFSIPRKTLQINNLMFGLVLANSNAVVGDPVMHRNRSQIAVQAAMWAVATLFAASAAIPAFAQDADDAQRGVARISVMDGQVSVKRGDAGEWVAGVINAPLLSDDSIATSPNSRAEVQFDSSNLLRIGGNAQIHLTTLEADRFQMELGKGTVTFRVLRPSNANVEVDTPSISVRPSKIGVYRISVNDAGETQLTVRSGDVEVFTPKGSQWVSQGQTMSARGTSADPEFQMRRLLASTIGIAGTMRAIRR